MKKKLLPLLLAFTLLLGLAACGSGGKEDTDAQLYYTSEFVPVTQEVSFFRDYAVFENTAYIMIQKTNNPADPGAILRIRLDGGGAEELPDYEPVELPPDDYSYMYSPVVWALQPEEDGTLWESLQIDVYGDEAVEHFPILRRLDGDGKELSRTDFPAGLEAALGMGTLRRFFVDGDGDIFAQCDDGFALLDEKGEPVFSLDSNGVDLLMTGMIAVLGDGRIGLLSSEHDFARETVVYTVSTINKDTRGWEESFRFSAGDAGGAAGAYLYSGNGYALFYCSIGDTLCAWRQAEDEEEPRREQLVNLLDVYVSAQGLRGVSSLPDGRILLVTEESSGTDRTAQAVRLTPGEAGEKKELTFAALGLYGGLRQQIMEFNRTSQDYHISVTDYTQYGGRQEAITRLITEIDAGQVPDLLETRALPLARWADRGLLEDLWPYIDGDPELSRDQLMERVLEASETDGKLCEVGSSFWFLTLVGAKSTVGDAMTWTKEDMMSALEGMAEGCIPYPYGDRTGLLLDMTVWPRVVDWESGTCHFDSPEFRSLLAFCAAMPESAPTGDDYTALLDRRQMLIVHPLLSFDALAQAEFLLGGEISYVGYPNEWGETGSQVELLGGVAMTSSCADKAGAWSFLRTLLLPQGDLWDSAFHINRADFDLAAERAMEPQYETDEQGEFVLDENGEKIPLRGYAVRLDDGTFVEIDSTLTQTGYDALMALYNAVDRSTRSVDANLRTIVSEGAGAYFAGDKTLDQTVELIQKRAQLYIEEQS